MTTCIRSGGQSDAWNYLGALLAELQELEEACRAFRQTLAVDPAEPRAHYNLADTLDDLGRTAEALPHWQSYLRCDGASRWAKHARGRIAAQSH